MRRASSARTTCRVVSVPKLCRRRNSRQTWRASTGARGPRAAHTLRSPPPPPGRARALFGAVVRGGGGVADRVVGLLGTPAHKQLAGGGGGARPVRAAGSGGGKQQQAPRWQRLGVLELADQHVREPP